MSGERVKGNIGNDNNIWDCLFNGFDGLLYQSLWVVALCLYVGFFIFRDNGEKCDGLRPAVGDRINSSYTSIAILAIAISNPNSSGQITTSTSSMRISLAKGWFLP